MLGRERLEGVVRFEGFALDLRNAELRSPEGKTSRLSEQPLRILVALLERPGELVLREELRKRLWPNDTVVEFEHSISAAVNRLRQVLGDTAENPKFIETLARRGYRWKTSVQREPSQSTPAVAKPPDGHLIGKKVSHYRVLQVLGGGGMGVVYKAEDIKLGRRVALKFLPEELAGDGPSMQRFEREARAASSLNHPNICTIYSVEDYEGQPFIVMELLEGQTLRDAIAQQANTKPDPHSQLKCVLSIAIQISNGIAAAHKKNIIHRDIKPANIFVTDQGQAKILDFGLAKLHDLEAAETQSQVVEPEPRQDWNPLLTLTRTGVTVGTAAYMSPEQVRGEKLDSRTDLFSLGLVIYEMATGTRAFPGETAAVLHDAILNQTPPPVCEVNSRVPPRLENIISRAMEKDKKARYQSAEQLSGDLEALQQSLAPKHLPRMWAVAFAVAATILVGGLAFLIGKPPKTIAVAPEIRLRQLTTNSSENPVIGGAISPDGKYLQYSDTRGMHLKLVDTGESRTIPGPQDLKNPIKWSAAIWFPDSTRFLANAYPAVEEWNEWSSATASIWVVSVLGGEPTRIRDHAALCGLSPDGSTVSFAANRNSHGEREVWFMDANGEHARKYYEVAQGKAIDCLAWSPDGKYYGWVMNDQAGDSMLSQKVAGGPVVTLFSADQLKGVNDVIWLHDGRVLYDRAEADSGVCNYWMSRIDPDTGKRLQQPTRLTNWPSFCVASGSVTNDDKKITFAAWTGFMTADLADLDAGGARVTNARSLAQEESDNFVLDWMPDGKSVIVDHHRTPDSYGLYRRSLEAQASESLLSPVNGGSAAYASISPDGKWIIVLLWPSSQPFVGDHFVVPFPLLRFPISGGAPETLMQFATPASVSCPKAVGKRCIIVEESLDKKQMVVSSLDPITGRGPELARFELEHPVDLFVDNLLCVVSPDGTRLALTRSPEAAIEIYSTNGRGVRKIPYQNSEKIFSMSWAADQKGLFVTKRAPSGTELVYVDMQGKNRVLRRCIGVNACLGLPSPDGRHLAIVYRKQTVNMWMMENF